MHDVFQTNLAHSKFGIILNLKVTTYVAYSLSEPWKSNINRLNNFCKMMIKAIQQIHMLGEMVY